MATDYNRRWCLTGLFGSSSRRSRLRQLDFKAHSVYYLDSYSVLLEVLNHISVFLEEVPAGMEEKNAK